MTARISLRQDSTLSQLLRENSLAHPERIAVISAQRQLTFEQFNQHCEQVADHLLRAGVQANQPVGVFLDPSIDLAISVWGVLHAGAAYLPLSPEYPDERLRYMIADAQVSTVLTSPELAGRLAVLVPPQTTVLMSAQAQAPVAGSSVNPVAQQPHNLAYLIYTSGSTGSPKGIGIDQHSIVNQMRWLAEHQGLVPGQVVLQKTPFSFDAAQWEILAPACGSTVVMSEPGAYGDPNRLPELIRAHNVTLLQCVPTLWQALVDSDELRTCGSLERIFSGGEALPKSLAVELLQALPQVELVNLYGPSECTINASSYTVDRGSVNAGPDVIPIGRPVDGIRFYVLDIDHNLVEPGESGELYISGVQLARGYLNRPDLTFERFLKNPFSDDTVFDRLYRSGDLVRQNDDGTLQFLGRTDSQVKLRGFRIELDEVKVAIESHDWVKRAAVLVREDPRTGANLVAFVELDPRQAALMDQGNHGRHHQSKQSRLQLAAQLSNAGVRQAPDQPRIELAGRQASSRQHRAVFARKTYRFFDGLELNRDNLLDLLGTRSQPARTSRRLESLSASELGELLRYFGQFHSIERLLPKYGYASPGALYATQLYLELSGVAGIAPGHYYYHPIEHRLVLIAKLPTADEEEPRLVAHFVGRRSAIEPVYRNNIQEVLQFEAGHMVGLFDAVLPDYGLRIDRGAPEPALIATLDCAPEDYYLASFAISSADSADPASGGGQSGVEVYLQAHPGRIRDLAAGLYRYADGQLQPVSDDIVLKRQVIAINQEVYERSSFGVSLVSRAVDPWQRYVDLGRALQRLQNNHVNVGLMAAGYSSQTGNDLPAARRIAGILGLDHRAASYFAIGGPITEEQRLSEGMREDSVHMRGPTEIIKDDLSERLPRYMMPNRVIVLDTFPLTVNGKIDCRALEALDEAGVEHPNTLTVAPRTPVEEAIASIWQDTLQSEFVSIHDDFFAVGGHSLTAVGLIRRINQEFGSALPLQVLFEAPTIAQLAGRIECDTNVAASRLVRLGGTDFHTDSGPRSGSGSPIFCWPGLGGYPMGLRLMASRLPAERPFYGVQAHGINPGEIPYPTLGQMADADIELIRGIQPSGPYTLWGYSFGARVAFEVAYRLELSGARVDSVVLIAPGQPPVASAPNEVVVPRVTSRTFASILYSVFAGNLDQPGLDECLAATTDEPSFVDFIWRRFEHLDEDLVRRLVDVVRQTFQFEYSVKELADRQLSAPISVFTAQGDQNSFVDVLAGFSAAVPNLTRVPLHGDHYGLLRAEGIDELISAIELTRNDSQFTP